MGNKLGGGKITNKLGGSKITSNKNAVAVFFGKYNGSVLFTSTDIGVKIDINLKGFVGNSIHGFHVHKCGDMRKMCDSMCDHFNPHNKTHGGGHNPSPNRHVGDLGNIVANNNGDIIETKMDNYISLDLKNINSIIGRGLIIHEDADDCGFGIGDAKKLSLETGNSGKRIACAVIGICEN
jgi:Cu/Zn superoxide dismutase